MTRRPRLVLLSVMAIGLLSLAAIACGKTAKPSGWAPPAIEGDLLLVPYKDKFYALDPQTLQDKWLFPGPQDKNVKPSALYGSLAGSGSSIYVPAYNGNLYSVATDTGKASDAPFSTGQAIVGGVVVDGGTLYFGSSDGYLYAVDASNLQQRWKFKTDNEIWSTPAVSRGTVYVTSLDGKLYAVDANTGQLQWSYETAAGVASPPVLDEAAGLIYIAGLDSRLRAIDMNNIHEQKWEQAADNWFWTTPLVSNGVVFAGSLDGKVYAVGGGG